MPGAAVDFIDGKDLTFEESQGCVYYQKKRISLPGKPFEVLRCIHAAHPKFVSNEELRKYVWHRENVDPNLPQQHVSTLNKVLPPFGLHVHRVPNRGYFLARVKEGSPEHIKEVKNDKIVGADSVSASSVAFSPVVGDSGRHIVEPDKSSDELPPGVVVGSPREQRLQDRDLLRPIILTRGQLDHVVGTVEQRLKEADEEVWISGNDNLYVVKVLGAFVLRALKRGIRIKLLGTDPNTAAASMLAIIDPRFEGSIFPAEVNAVTEIARGWQSRYTHFEYKLLPILPAAGYFITDPDLPSKTVKVEIYTAQPWDPLDSRPHFVIDESMPEWRDYFIQQFKNYWNLGETPW